MNRKRASHIPRVTLLALAMGLAMSGVAHDDHDHEHDHKHSPGAHVHGEARMQLGIEGYRAEVALDTPAVNVIGFERAPRNKKEEEVLESAAQRFRNEPLVQPEQQGESCEVESAEVHSALLHDRDAEGGHAEFSVVQQLACSQMLSEGGIRATVLETYPDIERLRLEWISDSSQGATDLTPSEAVFQAR